MKYITRIVFFLCPFAMGWGAESETWTVNQGSVSVKAHTEILDGLSIEISGMASNRFEKFRIKKSNLRLETTNQGFDGFRTGIIQAQAGINFTIQGRTFTEKDFRLVPAQSPEYHLDWIDAQSNIWFHVTDTHPYLDPKKNTLVMLYGDLRLGAFPARIAGHPDLERILVGRINLELEIDRLPTAPSAAAQAQGLACVPNFGPGIDLRLTGMNSIDMITRSAGDRVALAPSAALENVGLNDIRWYWAIAPSGWNGTNIGPHPLLVMHLYRSHDGRFEQIGRSDVKHAFNTVNSACACSGGQVMFVGCHDNYGAGSNSDQFFFGPREEISAHPVSFTSQGSHFDNYLAPAIEQNDDVRSHFDEAGDHGPFDHLLTVQESDLNQPGAEYFCEVWYLAAGDTNIFNSMGYRKIQPNLIGSVWFFGFLENLSNGPAINAWTGPNTTNTRVDTGTGMLQLAGRAAYHTNGLYQYDYALMNLDFDPQIRAVDLPMLPGTDVTNVYFSDGDTNAANDWIITLSNDTIHLAGDGLDWGTLFSFGFEATAAPGPTSATLHELEGMPAGTVLIDTCSPILKDTDGDGEADLVDPDDDNDGMTDAYENQYGLNPLDPSDADQDPDADSLTNLDEFMADTNPTNFFSFLSIKEIHRTNGTEIIFDSSTQRLYSLEVLSNLFTGEWQSVEGQTNVLGQGIDDSLIDSNPPLWKLYYRLQAKPPL